MAFSFKQTIAAIKEARKVQVYLREMTGEERGELVVHTATEWESYGFNSKPTSDQVISFLLGCNMDEIKSIHENTKDAKKKQQAPKSPQPSKVDGKVMSLMIPDGYTASQAMVVLRDINNVEKINLIVLDVDAGDYIPISPRLIAQLLVTAAENMIAKQDEIEQTAQGH